MICNGYPYLIRNLLHKILCIMQPVVHSTHENKSQSPPEVTQNSNLVPVTYSPMEVEGSLLPTLYKQWLEAVISNQQDNRDGRWEWTTTSSLYPSGEQRNKGNPWTRDGKCAVLTYVRVNFTFQEILKKFVAIWVMTHSRVNLCRRSCTEQRCVA